jgi:molybdopterin synthase sulfur carrier subunit
VRVRVLYFAAVRDLVAMDEETVDLPPDVRTVGDFARWISTHHAPLSGRIESVRVARNELFARNDESLAQGDVLALIPPVAGGCR